MAEDWPTQLYDEDDWPELVRKPDGIYFSGGAVFIDGVHVGECGETEIVPKQPDPDE